MEKIQVSESGESELGNEYEELVATLPKVRIWGGLHLYQYHGCWVICRGLKGMIGFRKHFQARDSDIIIITATKSGTTWTKALTFAIVNRAEYPLDAHPLLTRNPHELVRFFEVDLYAKGENLDLQHLPSPRILSAHTPYPLLPPSIKDSSCRIIYVARNPLDQFISYYMYFENQHPGDQHAVSLERGVEMFCEGINTFGPAWEHVLGFWNESLKRPDKILFLKYEDMKEDIVSQCKKLADFVGYPFSQEEERQGVVEQIVKLCSLENMKNLEVNKHGQQAWKTPNSTFFRKGKVGDWANYLTPSMAERIDKITKEKFAGTGLSFPMPVNMDMKD